jgi:hypothetical protein
MEVSIEELIFYLCVTFTIFFWSGWYMCHRQWIKRFKD